MQYGLLNHSQNMGGLVNYGDHIQSLAARQYLPKVDVYLERDRLNDDYPPCKAIMNGWYTYAPKNWPPNPNIRPLFTSFHLNARFADELLSKPENVDYLKQHSPIGCRDFNTLKLMESKGIEAYYSFCLTTTLDIKYKQYERNDNVYFVDVLYEYDQTMLYKSDPKRIIYHLLNGRIFKTLNLKRKRKIIDSLVPSILTQEAIHRHQYCSSDLSIDQKFAVAESAIRDYATAKLVVTSRIHCALPCLALGTPVLFVYGGLDDDAIHLSRLNGTIDHLNILTEKPEKEINAIFGKKMNVINPHDISWDTPPQNPDSYIPFAKELKERCAAFIGG